MVTGKELRELMHTQEPVLCYDKQVRENIEFKCVQAIRLRYNPHTQQEDIEAELMDKTGRCIVMASLSRISRKEK